MQFKLLDNKYLWFVILIATIVTIYYLPKKESVLPPIKTEQEIIGQESQSPIIFPEPPNLVRPAVKSPQIKLGGLVNVVSPKANEVWAYGKNHLIQWDKIAGHTAGLVGGIYLVNAKTNEIAGWIVGGIAPNQTSQNWDTKSVFLSKNSPVKKDIGTGIYTIKLNFNGIRPEAQSSLFSILYPEQIQIIVHSVSIDNFTFVPSTININRGDKILFTNNDSVTHTISALGYSIKSIPAGETYEFSTVSLVPGKYDIYSEAYPSTKAVLIVK